jgi:hypothetical protein
MARRKHPSGPNALSGLCSRYDVSIKGDGCAADCKRLLAVHHNLLRPALESDMEAIRLLMSNQLEVGREMWKRVVRIEQKLDTLISAMQPKVAGSSASEQIKKLASISYAMAKELERSGQ